MGRVYSRFTPATQRRYRHALTELFDLADRLYPIQREANAFVSQEIDVNNGTVSRWRRSISGAGNKTSGFPVQHMAQIDALCETMVGLVDGKAQKSKNRPEKKTTAASDHRRTPDVQPRAAAKGRVQGKHATSEDSTESLVEALLPNLTNDQLMKLQKTIAGTLTDRF